jgi:RND family efflux transporter MFP subunit
MNLALKIALPILVLAGGIAAMVALIHAKSSVETRPPERLIPLVRVVEIVSKEVQLRVRSQGTVAPRISGTLVPQVQGTIVWTADSWANGGFFEKGETLLRIDKRDYELSKLNVVSQVAGARLRLAQEVEEAAVARREWEALGRKLEKSSNRPEEPSPLVLREPQMAAARAALAAAEAAVDRAELDIERTEIKAPYAGRVREVVADFGDYVRLGSSLAHIYATDYVEVRLPIPDRELPFLSLPLVYRDETAASGTVEPDVLLTARFAGQTRGPWKGRIVRTEGEISSRSRMVHAIARVEDPYGRRGPGIPPLTVGLFVEAEILGNQLSNISVLPRHALRGEDQVLIVETIENESDASVEHKMRLRKVDVARRDGREVIVRLDSSEIAAGERVCVSPLEIVIDGMAVRVAEETDPR